MIKIFCSNCDALNAVQDDLDFGTIICVECEEEIGEIVCGAYQPDEDTKEVSVQKMFVVFLEGSCGEDSITERARGVIGRFDIAVIKPEVN